MSGAVLLQAVVTGLSVGAVFGLVGAGFSLVYGLLRVLAFAHGDVVVAAVFTGVLVVVGVTPVALTLTPADSVAMTAVAVVAGAAFSVATYLFAVRPFLARPGRQGDVVGWVAASVAAGLLVRALLTLALPGEGYAVPDPLHLDAIVSGGVVRLPAGATVPARVVAVLAAALVVAVVLDRWLARSRLGRGMRAVADDADAAALAGVAVGRVALAAFAVAGVVAGLAGVLLAPGRTLGVESGAMLGLDGIAAALLGGLGSVRGAVAGGLVLGVVQQVVVATPSLGAAWTDVVPLAVLVGVLAWRPEGLGRAPRAVAE
jgi:branched-chain amino acid transport system permease protein